MTPEQLQEWTRDAREACELAKLCSSGFTIEMDCEDNTNFIMRSRTGWPRDAERVLALVAEVKRLREALTSIVKLSPRVDEIWSKVNGPECFYCGLECRKGDAWHSPDCPWLRARAALGETREEKDKGE